MRAAILAACVALCRPVVAQKTADEPTPSRVGGTVRDVGGTVVSGAHVRLHMTSQRFDRETDTDAQGQYKFTEVPAGVFVITVTEPGLATQTITGAVDAGQGATEPAIVMPIATAMTTVDVSLTRDEIAEQDIRGEEQQRVLGLIPNFFVSFKPDAVPLTARQKFKLATRAVVDPVTFAGAAITAAFEQANNTLPGYGTDGWAYAERFGAAYTDSASATMLRGAVFPALLHQDPRYYYKGSGSVWARTGYALSTAVRCKGDNGRWQPNYSSIFGNLSAGALTNLYYPPGNRTGAAETFEDGALNIGAVAIGHVLQEFLYSKLTFTKHR